MEGGKDSTLEDNFEVKVRNCEDLNEVDKKGQVYINKVNIQKM